MKVGIIVALGTGLLATTVTFIACKQEPAVSPSASAHASRGQLKTSVVWVQNADDPYDAFGSAIRDVMLQTNGTFQKSGCGSSKGCMDDWARFADSTYRSNSGNYLLVDVAKVRWTSKEDEYREAIRAALLDKTNGLETLKSLESEIAQAYGPSEEDQETRKALLLVVAAVKYMAYTIHNDPIDDGSSPSALTGTYAQWEDRINDCMVVAIESATIIEILTDHGAGPGAWVWEHYIDCAVRTYQ